MTSTRYDAIIIGAGTSGLNVARELCKGGMKVLGIEAGHRFDRHTYPDTEVDIMAQSYWGGGVELNTGADIAIMRPKVVGGGSIVNQALMDRFDNIALDDFRSASGVDFMSVESMAPYFERAESNLSLQYVPEEHRNGNAEVFAGGFTANGYKYAKLRRAQDHCRFEDGNTCIDCLGGCKIDSKQSAAITALPVAEAHGFTLKSQQEVVKIEEHPDRVIVHSVDVLGSKHSYEADRVVMASGAIGNTRLLLNSGFGKSYPALGENFYTHPQYMNFGLFDHETFPHEGPLQNYKSADPGFRRQGFKLENVYAGPASLSMLIPGWGVDHLRRMANVNHYGCIEVCIRDQNPGKITVDKHGFAVVRKDLDQEDRRRREAGMDAIRNIFYSMGAKDIIEGDVGIGLHLMGGCAIGTDDATSVVDPTFTFHNNPRIHAADSSIFPNAPGINPALSIMAFSIRAAESILKEA